MATISKKNMFNEATRVQMPAMVHLTRLGYTYFGKITEDMAGTVYDPDTNILRLWCFCVLKRGDYNKTHEKRTDYYDNK